MELEPEPELEPELEPEPVVKRAYCRIILLLLYVFLTAQTSKFDEGDGSSQPLISSTVRHVSTPFDFD